MFMALGIFQHCHLNSYTTEGVELRTFQNKLLNATKCYLLMKLASRNFTRDV